jgi:hypothetical protein
MIKFQCPPPKESIPQAGRREEEVRQEKRVLEKRCREADGEVLLLQKRLEAKVGLASGSRSCRPGLKKKTAQAPTFGVHRRTPPPPPETHPPQVIIFTLRKFFIHTC